MEFSGKGLSKELKSSGIWGAGGGGNSEKRVPRKPDSLEFVVKK